ncbi:MAG: PepSY-associated TM helix domain-containing protein [Gemmatimonadota bacterium]|jgi:uncharacterized iron-regulated membrane protein
MPFRKVVFWIHLACGVAVGAVVLIMSVTGVLLTYQKQMTEWADRQYWVPPELGDSRASFEALLESAEAHDQEVDVSSVTYYSDPVAPVAASLGRGRTVYLDPSTAGVRGENTTAMRSFFSAVVGWHRWFNVSGEGRGTARAVTGWSNLVFLFLVLSGLYLWVPRRWRWQHFKPILLLDPKARGKARDFNWHHVFGFWMAVPLAVVVASATVISFPWASDLAYRAAGDPPPERRGGSRAPRQPPLQPSSGRGVGSEAVATEGGFVPLDRALVDPLIESARGRVAGWRTMSVTVPDEADEEVRISIDRGWGGAPQKRHTLTYDAASGRETAFSSYEDQSPGRRFRTYLRFAHTGEYYGLLGQTLAGLASFAGVLLVWSGIALAWRRLVRPLLKARPQRS